MCYRVDFCLVGVWYFGVGVVGDVVDVVGGLCWVV